MERLGRTLLAVVVWMALAGPVSAAPADYMVGNGDPNSCVKAALDAALTVGGLITFNCGGPKTISFSSATTISQDTTLNGGDVITLTGGLSTRLFVVNSGATLTLRHIVLDQAASTGSDGGAIVNHGALVLDHTTIEHSQTDSGHSGGAIFSTGPVSLNFSTLASNSAGSGGAIYLQAPAHLTVVEGHLDKNLAAADGGALYLAPGASADIRPGPNYQLAHIGDNFANHSGGAVFNQGGVITMLGGDLQHNGTLTTSLTYGYGGAIDDQGLLNVSGSLFADNEARYGGALYVGGAGPTATAAISYSGFDGNDALEFGGALYTDAATATVSIEGSWLDANGAFLGGGLARINAHLSIAHSSFTDNQGNFGGGLFVEGQPNPDSAGYVEVHDSTFDDNQAVDLVSGALDNSALLDLRNVTIKDNQGGLYDQNGAVGRLQATVLDNGDFSNCSGDGTLPASAGHNLATDNTCHLSAGLGDRIGVAAQLGPPIGNDPLVITRYYMPLAGSPLIHNGGPGCSSTDQRYATRVGACDIGAVEFGGLIPLLYVPLIQK